jgi:hypothetical protein
MFRFTIRDLLWLMVVVGMACGWCINNRELNFRLSESEGQVARHKALYSNERKRRLIQEDANASHMRRIDARLANEADRRIVAEQALTPKRPS